MAFSSADVDAIDRAIASGVLKVRFSDGRQVDYRTTDDLLKARAFVAGAVPQSNPDPLTTPGGMTYAEWDRG
jgi:hypothetical protein